MGRTPGPKTPAESLKSSVHKRAAKSVPPRLRDDLQQPLDRNTDCADDFTGYSSHHRVVAKIKRLRPIRTHNRGRAVLSCPRMALTYRVVRADNADWRFLERHVVGFRILGVKRSLVLIQSPRLRWAVRRRTALCDLLCVSLRCKVIGNRRPPRKRRECDGRTTD